MPYVLVIAYDFPPHGAIGTMRTLRLVRQLHQDGRRVTVLTGSPKTYLTDTPVEPALEAQVPAGVEVLQVRAVRPFNALENLVRRKRLRPEGGGGSKPRSERERRGGPASSKKGRWLAALVAIRDFLEALLDIPDKESGWIAPAVVRGLLHMRKHGRPDLIYSSAPPWSGQVVALMLTRLSRRPWVADFRDPWARAPWRDWRGQFRKGAVELLERQVIGGADAVLFVTAANLSEFAGEYGENAAEKFHLIPNGCDPTEIEALEPLPPREEFVLLHAGTLYGARSPLPVVRAIAHAVARGALDPARFRLRLLGTVSLGYDLRAECRALGIEDMVEFVSRVTRAQSLREMKSASALLLVQTGTTVSVPGKAYEYLAAGRPILALSEEGETSALVRASGLGVSIRPDEPIETIEAALLEVMGHANRPLAPSLRHQFDGRLHAATTARLLLAIANHGTPVVATAGSPASAASAPAAGVEGGHR